MCESYCQNMDEIGNTGIAYCNVPLSIQGKSCRSCRVYQKDATIAIAEEISKIKTTLEESAHVLHEAKSIKDKNKKHLRLKEERVNLLGEIDKYYYCSANDFIDGKCMMTQGVCRVCECYHLKHPNPEEYREEYGKNYPDEAAVYVIDIDESGEAKWRITEYQKEKNRKPVYETLSNGVIIGYKENIIICACTPFGIPGNDWSPQ